MSFKEHLRAAASALTQPQVYLVLVQLSNSTEVFLLFFVAEKASLASLVFLMTLHVYLSIRVTHKLR